MTEVVPAQNGWHWPEWGAEFAGTLVLMFVVVSAKYGAVTVGPPFSQLHVTILIVGVAAGLVVVGVAFSPLGRRSGGHINPAVTIGFWIQGVVGSADLLGYVLAQLAGGLTGVALAGLWGPGVAAPSVRWALIAPAPWLPEPPGAVIEAAGTFGMLVVVYALLLHRRTRNWAAPFAGATLALLIVLLATVNGAGFNPARALAPDPFAGSYPGLWTFLLGPVAGAAIAAALIGLRHRAPLTGKLHHVPWVACHMRCALTHHPRPMRRAQCVS